MLKRIGVIVLWVLATLGTASITLAAVSRVGGEVNDRPAPPLSADALSSVPAASPETVAPRPPAETGSEPTVAGSAPDQVPPTPDTSTDEAATTTVPSTGSSSPPSTTTTTVAGGNEGTTTTAPSGTSATTSSFTLQGGSVTVQVSGDQVSLVVANPALNFKAEIKESGPEKVVVEFKALDGSHESKFEAKVEGGELVVQSHEDSGGDDDDD